MSSEIFPFAVWQSGTNENSIPANDNALRNEVLAKGALGFASAAPGSPIEGDLHIVGAAWGGFSVDDVVIFVGGVWLGFSPFIGWAKTIDGIMSFYKSEADGWVEIEGVGGGTTGWDEAVSLASTSGSIDIDLAVPAGFVVSLNEDVTSLSFSNAPSGKYVVFAVTFLQDGTGGWEITWPAAVQGSPVQPNATPGSITIMSFVTWDGATTIYQAE